jgi:hypothetical protein
MHQCLLCASPLTRTQLGELYCRRCDLRALGYSADTVDLVLDELAADHLGHEPDRPGSDTGRGGRLPSGRRWSGPGAP